MIDFGLSQVLTDPDEMLTACCGTINFLAPELVKRKYRFDVDVWGVGICVYLLLFGRFPFSGKGDAAIVHEIVHKQLIFKMSQTKKEQVKSVSGHAKELCAAMLEKDPKKRISADRALQHRWIVQETGGGSTGRRVRTSPRNHNRRRRHGRSSKGPASSPQHTGRKGKGGRRQSHSSSDSSSSSDKSGKGRGRGRGGQTGDKKKLSNWLWNT